MVDGTKGLWLARTLSWIDRIVPIARTIAESSRSHYAREDLQKLFEIQPRSAQNLMSAMPVVSVGTAHLVERDALTTLLEQLNEAKDPTRAFALLRSGRSKPYRRKLRALSLNDVSADFDSLPQNLTISPGQVKVSFETVEQLAEAMVYLAALLQNHLEPFAARYELLSKSISEELNNEKLRSNKTTDIK